MKKIIFCYPTDTQPISITGKNCELKCKHCKGYYLEHMVITPNINYESFLISGGFTKQGKLPINKNTVQLLKKLKKKNKKINIHAGLVNEKDAKKLAKYADAVSFNFLTNNKIIKTVYNLKKTEKDFINSYKLIQKYCRVVPHVLIGFGNELNSLKLLKEINCQEVTFIILNPIKLNRKIRIERIKKILDFAKKNFKKVNLGCLRPKKGTKLNRKIEQVSLKYVDLIVNPCKETVELAKKRGYKIKIKKECCSL